MDIHIMYYIIIHYVYCTLKLINTANDI